MTKTEMFAAIRANLVDAEQIAFIKDSYGEGLVYDEDCPPSTPAQLARYQRANPRPFKKASL